MTEKNKQKKRMESVKLAHIVLKSIQNILMSTDFNL